MHAVTHRFQDFSKVLKSFVDNPVVLIPDGQISSMLRLDTTELGRYLGAIIVYLHPHSIHKPQPPDVTFMGPFKELIFNGG
jgi:hypothetical protein